jgi:hypothetical protein
MAKKSFEQLIQEIGNLLAEDIRSTPDGAFMYAEVVEGMIAASLFKDFGNKVIYRDPSVELEETLYDAWWATEADKRWRSMSYSIKEGRFAVSFGFPDEMIDEETFHERVERVVQARYGDKPVDYEDP